MLELQEIAPGIWVFPSADGSHNCGVVLGKEGVLLIDPTAHPTDLAATRRFIEEMAEGRSVRAVLFTQPLGSDEAADDWPGAARITAGLLDSGELPLPVTPAAGWGVLALSGRLGVYNSRERVLFCGDLLCEPGLGIPALAGGSQGYIDSLAAIEPVNARLVVPWRGSAAKGKRAIRERIENDRSYIYSLHRHVLTSMVAGVTLERVLQVAAEVYSDFPFLSAHLSNIRSVWEELIEE